MNFFKKKKRKCKLIYGERKHISGFLEMGRGFGGGEDGRIKGATAKMHKETLGGVYYVYYFVVKVSWV